MLTAMNNTPNGTERLRAMGILGLAQDPAAGKQPPSGGGSGNSTAAAITSAGGATAAILTAWMAPKAASATAKAAAAQAKQQAAAAAMANRKQGTDWTMWAMIGGGVLLIGGIGFVMLRSAGKGK